jgi:hypothetical protein
MVCAKGATSSPNSYRWEVTDTPIGKVVVMYVSASATEKDWVDALKLGTLLRVRVWATE